MRGFLISVPEAEDVHSDEGCHTTENCSIDCKGDCEYTNEVSKYEEEDGDQELGEEEEEGGGCRAEDPFIAEGIVLIRDYLLWK